MGSSWRSLPWILKAQCHELGAVRSSWFRMWTEVFLMSRLKKVMPSGAPTPQELMEVCDSHTELNSSCHSTWRIWYKPFPYVFPISLGLVAPSLLQMLPKANMKTNVQEVLWELDSALAKVQERRECLHISYLFYLCWVSEKHFLPSPSCRDN